MSYEDGFVSAYTKCNCFGIVASCDVIFGLYRVFVFNCIREMRNNDVIARAFGDKVDKIVKDFEFSVKQLNSERLRFFSKTTN